MAGRIDLIFSLTELDGSEEGFKGCVVWCGVWGCQCGWTVVGGGGDYSKGKEVAISKYTLNVGRLAQQNTQGE